MRDKLVKLADKFDQEGKVDLANAIDNLLATASRSKAPLKSLDNSVKKDLLKFIHTVQSNLKNSIEALEEFFRRLRYFDIGESIKDLKLDKTLKELDKTQQCADSAGKTMYTLLYGKHPSKSDLEQLAEDFNSGEKLTSNPLAFFESQSTSEDSDEIVDSKSEEIDEDSLSDEEYEEFIKNIENSDDESSFED